MCSFTATRARHTNIIAGAVLALTLSASTGALAQASSLDTQITAPKQVGVWTVAGWSYGYCTIVRLLPGAGGGNGLNFTIVRGRSGYLLGLGAPEWELTPGTNFPVELIAAPAWRGDANAIAVAPKAVMIHLGADGQLMKKLATAPMIEMKTAPATFKLPMDGFVDALAALDACFNSLNLPSAKPFARPGA